MMHKQIFAILIFGCVVATGCNSTRMFSRGDQSIRKGKYNEAIDYYDKGLRHSDNYEASLNKGIAEWRIRELSNAEKSFTDAIKTSPKNASLAFYYRAEIKFKTGRIKDALQDVNNSLNQDPLNVQALNLRGRIHAMEGRYSVAVGDLSAAITLEGVSRISGYLYHNRSIAYIGMDDFKKARDDFEQYIRFLNMHNLPVAVEDNYLLGILQYAVDNEDGALASWERLPSEEKARVGRIVGNSNSMFQF